MPPPLAPFIFPTLPSTWFIGHMSRALSEIQLLIQSQRVDLIIETRDARLPITSINPAFERVWRKGMGGGAFEDGVVDLEGNQLGMGLMGGTVKRLIVYNKRDLAQERFEEPLKRALLQHGNQHVLFVDSRNDADVKVLLQTAIRMATRELEGPEDRISMLVAGMPNVGKSSILNALRRVGVKKGKAASTSSQPGHTRRLSTVIKISEVPPTYIYDTPGIMVPFFGRGTKGKEMALKLALTGGIKESLFEGDTVVDYLIWRLLWRCGQGEEGYTKETLLNSLNLPLTTPITSSHLFLEALAVRLSAKLKGGEPDRDFAGRWLMNYFREGKLGSWTLDGLGRGGEMVDYESENATIDSAPIPIPIRTMEIEHSSETPVLDVAPTPAVATIPSPPPISASIDSIIQQFFSQQDSTEAISGHQAKKLAKVAQAKVREVKRKAKEVVHVKGAGISSARRRVYRRE